MLCECVVLPLTFCLHMLPHCLGLVVWTSVHSPLMQISLLPVWLSEGGFLRIDFIMSVTLSLTLGALYACHCFIILLFWAAINVRYFCTGTYFSRQGYIFFNFGRWLFFWVIVTTCSYNSICTIYVQGVMQNFPLFEPVLRQWLQSAYIHQPLEGCPQLSHRDLSM